MNFIIAQTAGFVASFEGESARVACYLNSMSRQRLTILYSGQVQGVGFRYSVKQVARGFDVVGTVRNLPDGRVELIAEGERAELEAFGEAIRDSGLGGLVRQEVPFWAEAAGGIRGFEIVR